MVKVQDVGCGVLGLVFRVQVLGFRVQVLGFKFRHGAGYLESRDHNTFRRRGLSEELEGRRGTARIIPFTACLLGFRCFGFMVYDFPFEFCQGDWAFWVQ